MAGLLELLLNNWLAPGKSRNRTIAADGPEFLPWEAVSVGDVGDAEGMQYSEARVVVRMTCPQVCRGLRSIMQNKDLRWVRPEYTFGSNEAEPAPSGRKRKASKSEPFVDDGKQETLTVAQIASLWQLSTDTIQRWFEDEPGVVASGNKNPRGKRKRVTLRIPREVMERVKRRMANK